VTAPVPDPDMTAARLASRINVQMAEDLHRPHRPVQRPLMPPIDTEELRRAFAAFHRMAGSIHPGLFYDTPPVPIDTRPWYRRMLGPFEARGDRWSIAFDGRDWTVGVSVGQEMVFISPLPMVTITYDRVGGGIR